MTSLTSLELAPQYDPRAIEADIYARWMAARAFEAHAVTPAASADPAIRSRS
jgi:hypothetical protein